MNVDTRLKFRFEEERVNVLRIVNYLTLLSYPIWAYLYYFYEAY